jgi:hypothetical protein
VLRDNSSGSDTSQEPSFEVFTITDEEIAAEGREEGSANVWLADAEIVFEMSSSGAESTNNQKEASALEGVQLRFDRPRWRQDLVTKNEPTEDEIIVDPWNDGLVEQQVFKVFAQRDVASVTVPDEPTLGVSQLADILPPSAFVPVPDKFDRQESRKRVPSHDSWHRTDIARRTILRQQALLDVQMRREDQTIRAAVRGERI